MLAMGLRVGSLFTGIGGFDLGLEMDVAWQVEIDRDCNWVLSHHFPETERFGDVRETGKGNLRSVDLICGGFPCQDLSVAGKRAGLDGERSGLWFEFHRVIRELSPEWVLIENVPGLLSSNGGRDFAVILSGLAELGYYAAWRILDAQYFGVAQRRRRVFVVGSLGDGRCAEVLFESACGCGHPPPGREKGEGIARDFAPSLSASGRGTSRTGESRGQDPLVVTPTLRGGSPGGSTHGKPSGTDQGPLTVRNSGQGFWQEDDKAATMRKEAAGVHESTLVAQQVQWASGGGNEAEHNYQFVAYTLNAKGGSGRLDGESETFIPSTMLVRRLTPKECLRLQGFPDDWLDLDPPLSDSAKYRMIGNAVAVPVVRWIGERIKRISKTS